MRSKPLKLLSGKLIVISSKNYTFGNQAIKYNFTEIYVVLYSSYALKVKTTQKLNKTDPIS